MTTTSSQNNIEQPFYDNSSLDASSGGELDVLEASFETMQNGAGADLARQTPVWQGAVPPMLVQLQEHMPDVEFNETLDAFVSNASDELVPALYTNGEAGLSTEGWQAVTEFVSSRVDNVIQTVHDFIEAGSDSLDPEAFEAIKTTTVLLSDVEILQDRGGLSEVPQGQVVSIASGVVNTLSQALAGAIASPDTGMMHLEDVLTTLETIPEALSDPTNTFLSQGTVTATNIEILNDGMVGDMLLDVDFTELTFDEQMTFAALMNPDMPSNMIAPPVMQLPLSAEDIPLGQTDESYDVPPPERPVVAEGEVPFFGRHVEASAEEVDAENTETVEASTEEVDAENTETVEASTEEVDAENTETVEASTEEVDNTTTDAQPIWHQSPVSADMFKIEELGEGVSELYNNVVDNAGEIISEEDFLNTGIMMGLSAYLEELASGLQNITPVEAATISSIIAPLLLDLDQGQFALEQQGLTDSPVYGVTQIMTEALGAVYYSGQMAQQDHPAGTKMLQSITPQVELLGNIFGEIADNFSEKGELNINLMAFFNDAHEAASDVYDSVYDLNDNIEVNENETAGEEE